MKNCLRVGIDSETSVVTKQWLKIYNDVEEFVRKCDPNIRFHTTDERKYNVPSIA